MFITFLAAYAKSDLIARCVEEGIVSRKTRNRSLVIVPSPMRLRVRHLSSRDTQQIVPALHGPSFWEELAGLPF